jgi:hypothetical protein
MSKIRGQFGVAPDATRRVCPDYGCMSGEPVKAVVELELDPDGVRGVLRAEHTRDLPFSGWLGLAVAVEECRRAAAASANGAAGRDADRG